MKEASVTRVSADLSFFFLLFALISPSAPRILLLIAFLAACTAFGFLAQGRERPLLRFLATLPPLLLQLAARGICERLALGAGWLYFTLLFTLDRAGMEYWAYRKAFSVMAGISVAACLLVSAALVARIAAPEGVYVYASLFCLLGIHTLRAMRMGVATDPGWKLYSILELLLPAALAGLLGAGLYRLLRNIGVVLELLLYPFALLLRWLMELLAALFSRYDVDTSIDSLTDIVPEEVFDAPASDPAIMSEAVSGVNGFLNSHSVPWKGIALTLLCAAALALLTVYLLRVKRTGDHAAETMDEQRFRVFRRKKKKAQPRANAEHVRAIYQEYLAGLVSKGHEIRQSDTSLDITPAGSEDERRLRQLYLIARYGDGGSLSAQDVSEARRCLERILERTRENGAQA